MQSPVLLQNIFKILYTFADTFKYFALFQHFFAPMHLLSRIGPDTVAEEIVSSENIVSDSSS